jgi:hypothetical protein
VFEASVISKSGQLWKVHASVVLIILGGIAVFWGQSHLETYAADWLIAGGMTSVLAGLVYACFGIRCRACGAKWFWLAMSKQASNHWIHWLLSQSACPNCKNDFRRDQQA